MLCILLINPNTAITEGLVDQIAKANPDYEIAGVTKGVRDSIKWICRFGSPDLIISSAQFADGSCCDIFRQCILSCPVIFLPNEKEQIHDDNFDGNHTQCLTIPTQSTSITKALIKFQTLQEQFTLPGVSQTIDRDETRIKKSRIIVRKGREYFSMPLRSVCLCFFENGLIFLVDKDNKKYMVEAESLNEVYDNLDRSVFFRANRKFIFNVNYLNNFKSIGNNRILLELSIPTSESIIISQYRSSEFKIWIDSL